MGNFIWNGDQRKQVKPECFYPRFEEEWKEVGNAERKEGLWSNGNKLGKCSKACLFRFFLVCLWFGLLLSRYRESTSHMTTL